METQTKTTTEYRVRISRDTYPESPREWDNIGTMVCWHRRYKLGDEQPTDQSPEEYLAELGDDVLILPLYLYDHGGITMSTTGFSCRWDSGQVGFIYVKHEKIIHEYGDLSPESIEKARKYLVVEVETYDQFLQGDIYNFDIESREVLPGGRFKSDWADLDSCGGFYGSDWRTNGMKDHIRDSDRLADLLDKASDYRNHDKWVYEELEDSDNDTDESSDTV